MPRTADPGVRERLLTVAARLLATEGRQALTTRRLAAESGTSTMAVYTQFGSMDRLQHEVRRGGFTQLCHELDTLPRSDDPVADLAAAAGRYVEVGARDRHLYRAMFVDRAPGEADEGSEVFERLLATVERCVAAHRFGPAEPTLARAWTAQVWMACHGMLTFAETGLLPDAATRFLVTDMVYRLAVGYGDRPDSAKASIAEGMARR